jgi:hypothetical protein
MREAHLAGLPGKQRFDRLASLNRASRDFGRNGAELERHLGRFLGTDAHVHELDDDFAYESVRPVHSYPASVATLRDVHRAIHRRLCPEPAEPEKPENSRTVWDAPRHSCRTAVPG